MARLLNGSSQYCLVNSIDFSGATTAVVSMWIKLATGTAPSKQVVFEYANIVGGVGGIGFDIVLGNPDSTHGLMQSYDGASAWGDTFLISDIFGPASVTSWVGITAIFTGGASNQLFSNERPDPVPLTNAGHTPFSANWSANAQFSVGARVPTPATFFFNGSVAEVKVWIGTTFGDARDAIGCLSGAPWPHWNTPDKLKLYNPLLGDASPEADYSAGHHPITLVGSPSVARHAGGAPYLMLPGFR